MTIKRRDMLRGAALLPGLAVAELVPLREAKAATGRLNVLGAKEFTTACNFCSCGCGMVGSVRDGKLVNLEGDPDHVINQGALCAKGAAMAATHTSDQRLKVPMYRAPGADKFQEITWDEAYEKLAKKIQKIRDENWVATEKVGDVENVPVNRTDAIGFMGAAQNTNEEAYLIAKMARLIGTDIVEHQARL